MIKAMKQMLEALESYYGYMEPLTTVVGGPRVPAEQSTTGKVEKAITAGRQAIEQAEKQEPVIVDLATMELAESVGLIGPASRTHDLHNAIQRFHDLICANATIKAAVAFSRTKE